MVKICFWPYLLIFNSVIKFNKKINIGQLYLPKLAILLGIRLLYYMNGSTIPSVKLSFCTEDLHKISVIKKESPWHWVIYSPFESRLHMKHTPVLFLLDLGDLEQSAFINRLSLTSMRNIGNFPHANENYFEQTSFSLQLFYLIHMSDFDVSSMIVFYNIKGN